MTHYNMFDYIKWRGDLTFEERPFNAIDALILNMVSFLDFDHLIATFPSTEERKIYELILEYFKGKDEKKLSLGLIIPKDMFKVAKMIIEKKRYKNIRVCNFINHVSVTESKQFAALTFIIDDFQLYITFRGTDDSLVGWAEDVSMLSVFPIPAQKDSSYYLTKIASLYPNKEIFIGGHSKGGNLSVYSSLYTTEEVQKRIVKVYSLDGPGFYPGTLDANVLNLMRDRIIHVIPNGGIVGRLFELDVPPIIVKSDSKGLDQHNPFYWYIECDHFVEASAFNEDSNHIKEEVDALIASMSEEDKNGLTEDLNSFIASLKPNNLLEFANMKNVVSVLFNKYKMKHKNIRYLLKLYNIFRRNKAIVIKFQN
ncbi:MAG: DUF2974 domain-containing protein [Coprobacillus sp.]|nr:DUF2974 domain-containing protein [Coprobacillus sp.]